MVLVIASLIISYLIGSIPFGVFISKVSGIDIRSHGSGNIGATNVTRVLGRKAGLATLLFDLLKGSCAVLLGNIVVGTELAALLCGVAAVFGHCISLPIFGRGGKGVATLLGVVITCVPLTAAIGLVIFLGIFFASRIVSLASCVSVLAIPIVASFCGSSSEEVVVLALVSLFIVYRHRDNLKRIIEGQEHSFKAEKKGYPNFRSE